MQAGAYQNGCWVVGVAKGGLEEGVESLAQSVIIAPSGQIVAQSTGIGDELITARCDLDMCDRYKKTLFDFDRYRRPAMYRILTDESAPRSLARASEETPSGTPHLAEPFDHHFSPAPVDAGPSDEDAAGADERAGGAATEELSPS